MGSADAELRRHGVALEYWADDGRSTTLPVGSVLRAREAEESDPYAVVVVVGIQQVDQVEEAVIVPFEGFGTAVSAPIVGRGGLMSVYEVLTEAEESDLRSSLAGGGVDLAAEHERAKAELLAARETAS